VRFPQRLIRNTARSRSVPTQWRHIRRSQRRRSARKLGPAARRPTHAEADAGCRPVDLKARKRRACCTRLRLASSWAPPHCGGLLIDFGSLPAALSRIGEHTPRAGPPHWVHGADRRGGVVVHCSSRLPHRVRQGDLPIRRWKAKINAPNTAQAAICKPLPREPYEGAGIAAALPLHAHPTNR
jgi:hypothetical protein